MNVSLIKNEDQNSTDLDKVFELLIPNILNETDSIRIIITGCLGDNRMDHNLSSMSHLIKFSRFLDAKTKNHIPIQIIHGYSVISCILSGTTNYKVSNKIEERNGVGLIPICGACDFIETKGLKWNLGAGFPFIYNSIFINKIQKNC
jgi:thiamine pyrophosphokinase